jgi:hypothetical protein
MKELAESLQIFLKYFEDCYAPTHCIHDLLILSAANVEHGMSEADSKRLEDLGWHWSDEYECWCSFRYGSN